METKRTKQIDFDLKHAQDASKPVEDFQQPKSETRSLETYESARTMDQLPSKKEQPSKALAALDRLQREDRMYHSTAGRRVFYLLHVELLLEGLVYYNVLILLAWTRV